MHFIVRANGDPWSAMLRHREYPAAACPVSPPLIPESSHRNSGSVIDEKSSPLRTNFRLISLDAMQLVDLIYRLIYDVAPIVMLLCVVVGACILWRRTKRALCLAQFIASLLLFGGFAFQPLRWSSVTSYDHSVYAEVMSSKAMRIGMGLALYIGCLAFSISYVWFALTHKRI